MERGKNWFVRISQSMVNKPVEQLKQEWEDRARFKATVEDDRGATKIVFDTTKPIDETNITP